MIKFYLDPKNLEKWLYQNKGKYIGNFVEGCLLDNFTVKTKNGYAAIYEHYLNDWTSNYYVEFQRGSAENVFNNWYKFEEKNEQVE